MNIDSGDIWVADTGARSHVIVLTGQRMARVTGRVVVAPEIGIRKGQPTLPSWVTVGKRRFAIERMQSLPADRLLERVGRATAKQVQRNEWVVQNLFDQR